MMTLTFSEGKLEIPAEVQEAMQLKEGAKLRLILASTDRLVLSAAEPRELPEWKLEPNDDWRSLRGILSDHPEHDTSKARADERASELEHDERKFGPFPKR
jgi:bifunctional DNA-binding transcriptional regulator/antitoxin component of YhaV-PrlF toxin-antitoxin module